MVVKIIIENRINKIANTSFGHTPLKIIEMKKQNSVFLLNENTYKEKKNNKRNKSRSKHTYKPGDMILVKSLLISKTDSSYSGPYKVLNSDNNNQTVIYFTVNTKISQSNIKTT
ncbi:hypothetical protein DMUE_0485 [Dictyocoela muelleri]|nr:hypothetical protein DMUE_0485 [Dictyocoela muelleri]